SPERSPTAAWCPSRSVRVLPPRKSIGPSRASTPTRRAARSRASIPPRRWARNASRVTGMYLSPAVVPEVLQYLRGRPGPRPYGAVAPHSGLDQGAHVGVGRQRDPALIVGRPANVRESVLPPPHGVAGSGDESAERALLRGEGIVPGHLHPAETTAGEPGEGAVEPPEEAHETAAVSGATESRNSSMARANASGCSSIGACPHSGTSRMVAARLPSRHRI